MGLLDKVNNLEEFFARADAEAIHEIVQCADGQFVWIDSRETFVCGYETMVFPCDEHGNVESWENIDQKCYCSYEEMQTGHEEMVKKWKIRRRIAVLDM